MEALYKASATAVGGRDGHIKSSDGVLDLDVRTPKELGGQGGPYTNPEQLFAAGYAACFNSALNLAARMTHKATGTVSVKVTVGIGKNDKGGFKLSARIDANVPGVTKEEAEELVNQAHVICPYSNATRGNIDVDVHATND